jgi:uncharacterized protein (DUF924 family)
MDEPWEDVLRFWLGAPGSDPLANAARWFEVDAAFDAEIRARFGGLVERGAGGALDAWRSTARGTLALVILLDQFPRNLHRGSARAFEHDGAALALSLEAQARGLDRELGSVERWFLYLPLMHAEDAALQARCVALFEALAADAPAPLREALAGAADFARRHRAVIDRFGRFPHRNAALGRTTTPEEAAFLEASGGGF